MRGRDIAVAGGFVLVLVALGVQLGLLTSMRRRIKSIHASQQRLESRLAVIEGWHAVPVLDDLECVELDGQLVKLRDYAIADAPELDVLARTNFGAPADLPHPQFLSGVYGRPIADFHPWQWSRNLLALAQWDAFDPESARHAEWRTAVEQGASRVVSIGASDFYPYPFDYGLPHPPTTEPHAFRTGEPWYSSVGQAAILSTMLHAHGATGDPAFATLADRCFASLIDLRETPGQDAPWVTFVDADQYLWFEEYPTHDEPQPRVINGHVIALMAIYGYWRVRRDPLALQYLRAGITTMERYTPEYRRPGQVLRYSLRLPDLPDYGPQRAVDQQRWLADLTGETVFEAYADRFATDMRMRDR